MEAEELYSGIQGKFQSASLGAGDIEAVEALMSMTKRRKTLSDRFRPLTPSSDGSEEYCVPLGSAGLQDSSLVSDLCCLGGFFRTSQRFCESGP